MGLSICNSKLIRRMNIPRLFKPLTLFGLALFVGIAYGIFSLETAKPDQTNPSGSMPLVSPPDSTPFQRAMARGDNYFNVRDYINAKASYQVAINLVPDDTMAQTRLRRTMDLLRSQKAQNILYDVAIASADKYFQERDYERARLEYENAGKLIPVEAYPKQRINEIIKILVDKQVMDEKYAKAIRNGDDFYQASDFRAALPEYQAASKLKPEEKYPRDRVAELTVIVKELKAKDDAYSKAITQADLQFKGGQYPGARKGYEEAIAVKPEQVYPANRIREIDVILARENKTTEDYERYIALGDSLYIGKNYLKARENYKLALSLKPNNPYSREMIQKSENMLTGQEAAQARALDEQYASIISSGDKLMADQFYEKARAEFLKAIGLKPLEQYPKDKIEEIGKFFNDQKAKDDIYRTSITSADKFFSQKNYDTAKTLYLKAAEIKPGETYPGVQVGRIDAILYEIEAFKRRGEEYKALISSADTLLAKKDYEPARTDYQKALDINNKDFYPKSKIAEIDRILLAENRQKAAEEKYQSVLDKGDSLMALKHYEPALTQYQNALKIKPSDKYPKSKAEEIAVVLESLAKQKAFEDEYNAVILKADALVGKKQYQLSKSAYEQALQMKPGESYPTGKILELNLLLSDLARVKEIDQQYQSVLANAGKLLLSKSYEQARAEFVNAGNLKPEEQYPKEKISEIDKIIGEIALKKELDGKYSEAVQNADKFLSDKAYEQSRLAYQNALALKSSEVYPKTKIAEIDQILAGIAKQQSLDEEYFRAIRNGDQLLENKSYEQARIQYQSALKIKPAEEYPLSKVKEIELILANIQAVADQYQAFITKADKFLLAKSYLEARAEFVNAMNLKAGEPYPKDKIAEIDKITGEIAAKKALDEQYSNTVLNADRMLTAKSYDQSRLEYQKALNLKPSETYPRIKIEEIDQVLATIAAQQALDAQYSQLIKTGDKMLEEKTFEEAKLQYQSALQLKPASEYPPAKIREIDLVLGEIAKKKALDDQYLAAIKNADQLFNEKSFDLSKKGYADASRIKPGEQYPKFQMIEIEKSLAAIAAQKLIDEKYLAAIAKADQSMAAKIYDQASKDYTIAAGLKPEAQYPKDRVLEIERVMVENKAREEAFNTAIKKADGLLLTKKYEEARSEYQNAASIKPESTYPDQKIAEINKALEELLGKRKLFENLLVQGETLLAENNFYKAKGSFSQASALFPEEKVPMEKIAYINAKVDSIYRANRGKYDKVIGEGDRYFNSYEYDKAIDAYNEAIVFLPMENYPREMIFKIQKIINENAIVDVFKSESVIKAGEEKQFGFAPVNQAARKNNFIYIKLKNLSGTPFNVLLRYGTDKQPGGGMVIKNLKADGIVSERLISVMNQDSWYRSDNNWISLYPQGGDIEVTFIQISRSR